MDSVREQLKRYIIRWNNRFPHDRLYRQKYNIGFNTEEHRALNQIDIYFDILEDQIYQEAVKDWEELDKNAELLKKGIWLKEQEVPKESEEVLFEKMREIDISLFNNSSQDG